MVRRQFFIGLALAGMVAGTAASAQQKAAPAKAPAKAAAAKAAPAAAGPVAVFEFQKGTVELEFFPAEAPKSVAKIVDLVRQGFYRGQRIWWTDGSAVQFGDPTTRDMTKRPDWGTVGSGKAVGVDETPLAKHKFLRGIVGFGHRPDFKPPTSDSYMFIIKGANSAADGKYIVLGQITTGMNVVDKLEVADRIVNAYMKGEKK